MIEKFKEIPMDPSEWIVILVMFIALVIILVGLYHLGLKWEEENEKEKEDDDIEDLWDCEIDERPDGKI